MGAQIPTIEEIEAAVRRIVREELGGRSSGTRRELISKREAARMLGIDRGATLSALISEGRIRVTELRGRTRVSRADVERVIADGAPPSAVPSRRRFGAAGGAAALRAVKVEDL